MPALFSIGQSKFAGFCRPHLQPAYLLLNRSGNGIYAFSAILIDTIDVLSGPVAGLRAGQR
jgi:hypothetical protein